jgi:small redox-active disulfide protein 2
MMYDVIQIRVGQHQIGIIGLKEVLTEVAQTMTGAPDEIIQKELLTWLSKRNYITNNAIDQYEQAFLGEYKKFVGEPFSEECSNGVDIKVLGPGCPKCQQTEKVVKEAVAEAGVAAEIEKVTDTMKIAGFGVFGTPTVVVDGEVKSVGKIPKKEEVLAWIK